MFFVFLFKLRIVGVTELMTYAVEVSIMRSMKSVIIYLAFLYNIIKKNKKT